MAVVVKCRSGRIVRALGKPMARRPGGRTGLPDGKGEPRCRHTCWSRPTPGGARSRRSSEPSRGRVRGGRERSVRHDRLRAPGPGCGRPPGDAQADPAAAWGDPRPRGPGGRGDRGARSLGPRRRSRARPHRPRGELSAATASLPTFGTPGVRVRLREAEITQDKEAHDVHRRLARRTPAADPVARLALQQSRRGTREPESRLAGSRLSFVRDAPVGDATIDAIPIDEDRRIPSSVHA